MAAPKEALLRLVYILPPVYISLDLNKIPYLTASACNLQSETSKNFRAWELPKN